MEPDVADCDSASQGHRQRLDRTVKVLVVNSIFIMPKTPSWSAYFIDKESSPIDSRIRLDGNTGCSSPGIRSRSHANCRSDAGKGETCCPGYVITTIGGVVIHV